jgi:hypothetical protein
MRIKMVSKQQQRVVLGLLWVQWMMTPRVQQVRQLVQLRRQQQLL